MRSRSIISAWVTVAALGVGCRPPPGAPARPGAPGTAGEEPARPSGVHTRASFSLGNGLRVVLEENHAAPAVAVQVWIGAGAADDTPGQEGTANVVQHVLQRSAAADPAAQSAGARSAAWASYDQTVVNCLIASAFVNDGLRALASAVSRPVLAPADFEAARAAARDDLRVARGDPGRVAAAAALAAAFAAHPYRRPLLGTEAALAALTVDQLRVSYARFFGAAGSTLVMVGDFDPVAVRGTVTTLFGAWAKGDRPSARAAEPTQRAPRVAITVGELATPLVALAWRTPDVRSEDRAALELLAALLGRGGRTRLEDELVRNRQLALDAHAFLFAARDPGLLVVTATLPGAGAVDATVAAIGEEAARIARQGPTLEELARARTVVEREEVAQKAGLGRYAGRLGLYATVAGDPDLESAHLRRLREIEAGDVKEVAARYLRSAGLTVAAVLPASRNPRGAERAAALGERVRALVVSADASARAATADATAPRPAAARNDVVVATLPSGVHVVVLPDDGSDEMAVRAVWPGGVRREDSRLAGAGALTARVLVRRTKTRSADQIAAELAQLGGRLEGFAGLDLLGVQGDFLSSRWERSLELIVDCLRNPRFADEDVETDRRVLLDEIRMRDDDPAAAARRIFDEALFGRHPYHLDVLGNVESVAGLTRRRLLDHFRANYGPRDLTIAVVGGITADRVIEKLATLFADAPVPAPAPAPSSPSTPSPPPPAEPREIVRFAPTADAQIVLGYPGVGIADPDRLALEVLGEILGGPGHRLAALRARGGVIDGFTTRNLVGVDPGAFSVHASARPGDVEAAVAALRAELASLVQSGVTADEVAAARRALVGRRALALAERGAVASGLALDAALGISGRGLRRDTEDLAKLSADDVTRVARRILDSRREVLAVVRPRIDRRPPPPVSRLGSPAH